MYICALLVCLVPADIREGIGALESDLPVVVSHHVLGFEPGSLQEQLMLFAPEPSLALTPGLVLLFVKGLLRFLPPLPHWPLDSQDKVAAITKKVLTDRDDGMPQR